KLSTNRSNEPSCFTAWRLFVSRGNAHGSLKSPAYSRISITLNRKRESQHHVSGCCASRSRLRFPACHSTGERMAAYQKSDQRRAYLCAGGLRKRAVG